jgi:hypothetical protein
MAVICALLKSEELITNCCTQKELRLFMLREFSTYRPRQVARFVKVLFKGQFSIEGIGEFRFDQGKVLLPEVTDQKKLNVFKEVNGTIACMSM